MRAVDLVIVGGGPAGLGAAIEAGRAGIDAFLVEERPTLGGQIYKRVPQEFALRRGARSLGRDYERGDRLIRAALASGVRISVSTVAWHAEPGAVWIQSGGGPVEQIKTRSMIVAAGAYDRPVPFPGWTMPGVMTAGAAQTLVKTQQVLPGRSILMAGSGPLLLAFAAQLIGVGANVVSVVEAAQRPALGAITALALAIRGNVDLLIDGFCYHATLRRAGVPFRYGHVVVAAHGSGAIERAVIARVDSASRPIPGTEETLEVDTICSAYGFSSSVELPRALGCAEQPDPLGGWLPIRDAETRSSVSGVYVAGDGAGVRGAAAAAAEGRLAAITAALDLGLLGSAEARTRALPWRQKLEARTRFARALAQVYAVGPGIEHLPTDDTIICRCEELSARDIAGATDRSDANTVKALTRVGMGRCQGRTCARAVSALVARVANVDVADVRPFSGRYPVRPISIDALATEPP